MGERIQSGIISVRNFFIGTPAREDATLGGFVAVLFAGLGISAFLLGVPVLGNIAFALLAAMGAVFLLINRIPWIQEQLVPYSGRQISLGIAIGTAAPAAILLYLFSFKAAAALRFANASPNITTAVAAR